MSLLNDISWFDRDWDKKFWTDELNNFFLNFWKFSTLEQVLDLSEIRYHLSSLMISSLKNDINLCIFKDEKDLSDIDIVKIKLFLVIERQIPIEKLWWLNSNYTQDFKDQFDIYYNIEIKDKQFWRVDVRRIYWLLDDKLKKEFILLDKEKINNIIETITDLNILSIFADSTNPEIAISVIKNPVVSPDIILKIIKNFENNFVQRWNIILEIAKTTKYKAILYLIIDKYKYLNSDIIIYCITNPTFNSIEFIELFKKHRSIIKLEIRFNINIKIKIDDKDILKQFFDLLTNSELDIISRLLDDSSLKLLTEILRQNDCLHKKVIDLLKIQNRVDIKKCEKSDKDWFYMVEIIEKNWKTSRIRVDVFWNIDYSFR